MTWGRVAGFLIRLHPPAWRRRYADEVGVLVGQAETGWAAAADLGSSAAREWSQVMSGIAFRFVARLSAAALVSYLVFWALFGLLGGFSMDARLNYVVFFQWNVVPAVTVWTVLRLTGLADRFRVLAFAVPVVAFGWLYALVFPNTMTLASVIAAGTAFSLVMSLPRRMLPTSRPGPTIAGVMA